MPSNVIRRPGTAHIGEDKPAQIHQAEEISIEVLTALETQAQAPISSLHAIDITPRTGLSAEKQLLARHDVTRDIKIE